MELVIHNIKSKQDIKLIRELVTRLGLKADALTTELKEDIGLSLAIEEGLKSGFVSEKEVLKTLKKAKGKK